jgi:hypothetical protein
MDHAARLVVARLFLVDPEIVGVGAHSEQEGGQSDCFAEEF